MTVKEAQVWGAATTAASPHPAVPLSSTPTAKLPAPQAPPSSVCPGCCVPTLEGLCCPQALLCSTQLCTQQALVEVGILLL